MDVSPLFRCTVKDAVPAVVAFGDTRTCESLLDTVTSMPPCCPAPSDALVDSISPEPTVTAAGAVIVGAETCTCRTPVFVIVRTPAGPVTVTVVVPADRGRNDTPPDVPTPIAWV